MKDLPVKNEQSFLATTCDTVSRTYQFNTACIQLPKMLKTRNTRFDKGRRHLLAYLINLPGHIRRAGPHFSLETLV